MGGFAAFLAPEATAAAPRLDRMIAAAPHRAPDGARTWADGVCHLGVLGDAILPEFNPALHPCVDEDARIVVALDGRIDNRGDLAAAFGWNAQRAAADDPAYALEAWRRWGSAAVERLHGDFALVAWCAVERMLWIARDRIGPRPVHWTMCDGSFMAASDIAQLVAATGTIPPPDESVAALFLACDPPTDGRTLFSGIFRLPAGHLLSVRPGEPPRVREYWRAEPSPLDVRRSDDDYAAECRSLLDTAVRARLRGRGQPAVFFSGGIDSSAVLVSAARIDPGMIALSQSFDEPECDERTYQQDLLAQLNVRGLTVIPDPLDREIFRRQAASRLTIPDSPSDQTVRCLRRVASREGARFALTGAGGDYIFGGSTLGYADLLRRGKFVAAVRQSSADWEADATGRVEFGLLRFGLWPLLPFGVRTRFRTVARRIAGIADAPEWLRVKPSLPPVAPPPPRGVGVASWTLAREFRNGWTPLIMEQSERSASEAGMIERYPLLDDRLTTFALSIPEEQRRRGSVTKYVLRRAVAPDLPASIAGRTTKAAFGHLFFEAVDALGGAAFFNGLGIDEAGWIDAAALRRRYDEAKRLFEAGNHEASGTDIPALWMAITIELWFRAAYKAAPRENA